MIETNLIPPVFGIVGLIVAFIIFALVLRYDEGEEKVKKIADAIHHGAMAFMRREYTMLALFAGVLLVALYFALGPETALSFLVGALASATAGWIGMYTATKANVRTTTAAHTDGAPAALSVAFFGGSIMGITVASMGLLGLAASTTFTVAIPQPHTIFMASAWAPPRSPSSPVWAVASLPRVRTSAPTWSANSKRGFPKTIREIPA